MEIKINNWIKRYGKTFNDPDFGYNDCDMIDSCMYDLQLSEEYRKLVHKLADEYIQKH